jgi:hypothetical protein
MAFLRSRNGSLPEWVCREQIELRRRRMCAAGLSHGDFFVHRAVFVFTVVGCGYRARCDLSLFPPCPVRIQGRAPRYVMRPIQGLAREVYLTESNTRVRQPFLNPVCFARIAVLTSVNKCAELSLSPQFLAKSNEDFCISEPLRSFAVGT